MGGVVEAILAALGTAWWVAAAIVFNKNVKEANDWGLPQAVRVAAAYGMLAA